MTQESINATAAIKRVSRSRRFGAFVLVLATATTASGLYTQYEQRLANECQTKINKRFIEALKKRSEIPAQESKANRDLFIALLAPHPTPERQKKAVEDYIKKSQDIERQRQAAPYPSGNCDD